MGKEFIRVYPRYPRDIIFMRTLVYPLLGLVDKQEVTPMAKVLVDEFEAGTTAARRVWGDRALKRSYKITHAPMTRNEYAQFRDFHSDVNDGLTPWIYRDNVNREGDHLVRFSKTPVVKSEGALSTVEAEMQEVLPVAALPTASDLAAPGGVTTGDPAVYFDPNREIYFTDPATGEAVVESTAWNLTPALRFPWSGGACPFYYVPNTNLNAYNFASRAYGASGANVPFTVGNCTMFMLVNIEAVASKWVLAGLGSVAAGSAFGIQLTAGNYFTPWIGGTETFATAKVANPGAGPTWHSLAVMTNWSNNFWLFFDGVQYGPDSVAHTLVDGKFGLGAAGNGTLNAPAGMSYGMVSEVLYYRQALVLAQINALHNLFAPAYGMTAV